MVVRDGYLYLFGGEYAFTGSPPPYFNDVWRTANGADWELVTPAAGWSPRPGHTCDLLDGSFVCFGGYGQSPNPLDVFGRKSPMDMWTSDDGATWKKMATVPWNARNEAGIRYDYLLNVFDRSIIEVENRVYDESVRRHLASGRIHAARPRQGGYAAQTNEPYHGGGGRNFEGGGVRWDRK